MSGDKTRNQGNTFGVCAPDCERQFAVKTDRSFPRGRAPLFTPLFSGALAVSAAALLSGCMSSPTYGTDKTATQQLFDDVTGIVSTATLTGQTGKEPIAYKPRPELVRPASLEVLPEPQREMATADNSAWPESPEQRRARLRAEATENQDNPGYRSPIVMGTAGNKALDSDPVNVTPEQRAEIERRRRERNQGSSTNRKYLSEPPLEYRVPNETAAVGELGEDEWKKQNRGKKAAGKSWSLRDLLPW